MGKMVSAEQLQRIEDRMKSAPKTEGPLSVGEAVKRLSGSIKQMRAKGYSWDAIADVLRTEGVNVSGVTLRRYATPKRPSGGG